MPRGRGAARDAAVIADQARMRRDLRPVCVEDELIIELQMLVAHRQDLVTDRTRAINRLRDQLLNFCPAIERVLDLAHKGPLILLTGPGGRSVDDLTGGGAAGSLVAATRRWHDSRKTASTAKRPNVEIIPLT